MNGNRCVDNANRRRTLVPTKACEQAVSLFPCLCVLCAAQAYGKFDELGPSNGHEYDQLFARKNYLWVLEQLGTASVGLSVFINIPETAVFRNGKPSFLLMPTRERTLKMVTAKDKLNPQEVIKSFINIVRNRKREQAKSDLASFTEASKETCLIRYRTDCSADEELSSEEGAYRVMTENEFTELMWQRPSSAVWNRVAAIQTLLKCKGGIGEPELFCYLGVRHSTRVQDLVTEKERTNGRTFRDLVSQDSQSLHALAQRVVYLVAAASKCEIMRMNLEFVTDDHGRVWLTYIDKILVRELVVPVYAVSTLHSVSSALSQEAKERYLKFLEHAANQPRSQRVQAILEKMNSEAERIKTQTGVAELFAPKTIGTSIDEAFRRLRPGSEWTLEEHLRNEARKAATRRRGASVLRRRLDFHSKSRQSNADN